MLFAEDSQVYNARNGNCLKNGKKKKPEIVG